MPTAVGVPEITPVVAFSSSPAGRAPTETLNVSGLPPGHYYFQCDVHPFMNGTLVVLTYDEDWPPVSVTVAVTT